MGYKEPIMFKCSFMEFECADLSLHKRDNLLPACTYNIISKVVIVCGIIYTDIYVLVFSSCTHGDMCTHGALAEGCIIGYIL